MGSAGRYHHGDLREALLDAVFQVVAAEGVDAVKVSALARACGVSSGAPFRHFASREALLVAAAERAAEHQIEVMAAASAGVLDPIGAQRAQGVAYVRWAVENPGAFRLLADGGLVQASAVLQAQSAAFRQQMDAVLGAEESGTAASALLQRTAAALAAQSMVYGLAKMLVDGTLGERTPEEAELLAWEVTGVLGRGLGRGSDTGTPR